MSELFVRNISKELAVASSTSPAGLFHNAPEIHLAWHAARSIKSPLALGQTQDI